MEKLSPEKFARVVAEENSVFDEYISLRGSCHRGVWGGNIAKTLEEKAALDKQIFGRNSKQVACDYALAAKEWEAGHRPNKADRAQRISSDILSGKMSDERLATAPGATDKLSLSIRDLNLASDYMAAKSVDQSPALAGEALLAKARLDAQRENSPILDFEAIARDLEDARQYRPAAIFSEMASAGYRKAGAEPFTVMSALDAAIDYSRAGMFAQAEPLYRQALSLYDSLEKDDHTKQSTPRMRGALGHSLLMQGKNAEAETVLLRSLSDARIGFGDINRYGCQFTLRDLATVEKALNKPDEAAKYTKLAEETEARYKGEDDTDVERFRMF